MLRRAFHLGLVAFVAVAPATALGAAYQIDARTEAQAYEIRSYRQTDSANPVLLPRRRIVQYLGINAYELITGQDLGFESNLRVFQDFGVSDLDANRVDGLHARDVDLLLANVRYKHGGIEAQLGRQIYPDVMETFGFDGLRLRYVSPLGVGGEAYGGLWNRGSGFLSTSVWQPDGVRETDIRRLRQYPDPNARPVGLALQPTLDSISPVYGARLIGDNVAHTGVCATLGYRKSLVEGNTDYERLTASARYGKGRGINAWAGIEYDVIQSLLSQAQANLRYDTATWAASLELMRLHPTFSSSSIWYYFAFSPRHEARLRGDYTPLGDFRYYAQVIYSIYDTPINEGIGLAAVANTPGGSNGGGNIGAAYRPSDLPVHANVDVTYRNGYGGKQLWLDLNGGYSADQGRWTLDGRFSVANVNDQYNPLLRGTFYGAQLWGSYAFSPLLRASVAVEENVNPFTQSDTKVFFLLDVKAIL
ncbi:MAG: hypothetical protein ACJ790_01215 [Myxococcaceae bacterium]